MPFLGKCRVLLGRHISVRDIVNVTDFKSFLLGLKHVYETELPQFERRHVINMLVVSKLEFVYNRVTKGSDFYGSETIIPRMMETSLSDMTRYLKGCCVVCLDKLFVAFCNHYEWPEIAGNFVVDVDQFHCESHRANPLAASVDDDAAPVIEPINVDEPAGIPPGIYNVLNDLPGIVDLNDEENTPPENKFKRTKRI